MKKQFDLDTKQIQNQILTSLVGVFLESETLMDKMAVKKRQTGTVWNHSTYWLVGKGKLSPWASSFYSVEWG